VRGWASEALPDDGERMLGCWPESDDELEIEFQFFLRESWQRLVRRGGDDADVVHGGCLDRTRQPDALLGWVFDGLGGLAVLGVERRFTTENDVARLRGHFWRAFDVLLAMKTCTIPRGTDGSTKAFDEYWRVMTQQWRRHELSLINACSIYFQLESFLL